MQTAFKKNHKCKLYYTRLSLSTREAVSIAQCTSIIKSPLKGLGGSLTKQKKLPQSRSSFYFKVFLILYNYIGRNTKFIACTTPLVPVTSVAKILVVVPEPSVMVAPPVISTVKVPIVTGST